VENRTTIFAYGAGRHNVSSKKSIKPPQYRLVEKLKQKAVVVNIWEYNTSQRHSACGGPLDELLHEDDIGDLMATEEGRRLRDKVGDDIRRGLRRCCNASCGTSLSLSLSLCVWLRLDP
jgi:hypothetical protein